MLDTGTWTSLSSDSTTLTPDAMSIYTTSSCTITGVASSIPYSISIDPSIITSGTISYGCDLNLPAKGTNPDKLTNKYENDSHYKIRKVKEIVPDKVFEFQIYTSLTGTKTIKTVCGSEDVPSMEYACALALAKAIYKDYTFSAIIDYIIPNKIFGSKIYLREIKHGVKIIKENRRIALLEKEKEEIKARQKKRRAEQKRRRAERRENKQINIIKKAINASKNGD